MRLLGWPAAGRLRAASVQVRRRAELVLLFNVLVAVCSAWLFWPQTVRDPVTGEVLGRPSMASYTLALASLLFGLLAATSGRTTNRVLAASCVALFLAGELAYRRAIEDGWIGRFDDSTLFRQPVPYIEFTGSPGAVWTPRRAAEVGGTVEDAQITFNSLGFRGLVPPMPKGNEYRVIIIGGSAVVLGAPLQNSIPGQLEQQFQIAGRPEVRVYNWGVVSFNSTQELVLLTRLATDFAPDLVLVYDGANDVLEPYTADPRPGYPYNWPTYEAGISKIRDGDTFPGAAGALLSRSRLLTRLSFRPQSLQLPAIERLRREAGHGSPEWEDAIVRTYLSNVQKMCAIGRAFGFDVAVGLQPLIFLKDSLTPEEQRAAAALSTEYHRAFTLRVYSRFAQGLSALARQHAGAGTDSGSPGSGGASRCALVDVSEALRRSPEPLFLDLVHVTNKGNALVASELHRLLSRS